MSRLGMILPSSNTVVEPVCTALLAGRTDVTLHFARFALTAVTVADPAKAYYESGVMLEAARLLADARCDVITWNGSAGGAVGFDRDRWLVKEIEARTGITATTSSLTLLETFRARGVKRFAGAVRRRFAYHFAVRQGDIEHVYLVVGRDNFPNLVNQK